METGLKMLYMSMSAVIFATAMFALIYFQRLFDNGYGEVMEVINGGYLW